MFISGNLYLSFAYILLVWERTEIKIILPLDSFFFVFFAGSLKRRVCRKHDRNPLVNIFYCYRCCQPMGRKVCHKFFYHPIWLCDKLLNASLTVNPQLLKHKIRMISLAGRRPNLRDCLYTAVISSAKHIALKKSCYIAQHLLHSLHLYVPTSYCFPLQDFSKTNPYIAIML